MFSDTPFQLKKIHCSKHQFERWEIFSSTIESVYHSVAAGVARRREGVRGIFFPRGGTLWCKANPFAVIKGGKG